MQSSARSPHTAAHDIRSNTKKTRTHPAHLNTPHHHDRRVSVSSRPAAPDKKITPLMPQQALVNYVEAEVQPSLAHVQDDHPASWELPSLSCRIAPPVVHRQGNKCLKQAAVTAVFLRSASHSPQAFRPDIAYHISCG